MNLFRGMRTYIKQVKPSEAAQLRALCTELYTYYFSDHWIGDGLIKYLEEQFGRQKISRDLENPLLGYFFVYHNTRVVGFLKINYEVEIGVIKNKKEKFTSK